MNLTQRRIELDDGDSVSAVLVVPERPPAGPAVIIAHGAGNDMHAPFLSALHEGLARCGYPTLKFNFPYKEDARRGPDRPAVLEMCYRRVLHSIRGEPFAARGVVIGGKSLGGRIASHIAASGEDVAGLIFFGYPLHPPRRTDQLRVAHLSKIHVPMLFFCGTRDPLCDLALLRKECGRLTAPVTLQVIEGGDHSFNVPKSMHRSPAEVCAEIVELSAQWLKQLR